VVRRPGIAATSASAVVFSIVLLSNFGIYVSSQDRAALYSQSDLEDYVADYSIAFAGASGANVLIALQGFLAGQTFDCASAPSVIAAEIGGLSDAQSADHITETAVAGPGTGLAVSDNLSSLAPFNGSLAGVLDLSLRVSATGGSPTSGVVFEKSETHTLHLPFRLGEAVADCIGAAQALVNGVSGFQMANCTSAAVASFMSSEASLLEGGPAAAGFEFRLAYTILNSASCSVGFQISIEQLDIQGIGGEFSVLMEENGTASFATPG